MLHRIYLIRHGQTDGEAPTGNHADLILSQTGIHQANQTAKRLALENLPINIVYSSPHYHCLETLRPIVTDSNGATVHQVRVENGLRDWEDIDDLYPLCVQQCAHKRPTNIGILQQHFKYIDPKYTSMVTPPPEDWKCEPPRRLLLRAHFTIDHIIRELDQARLPQTVLICTHAPVVLAIARILVARQLPVFNEFDPEYQSFFGALRRQIRFIAMVEFIQPDHHAGHCSISRFDRISPSEWPWKMTMNGDQRHLTVRSGAFRFRPSPWQNRHAPHPVLAVLGFLREFPGSLLWGYQSALGAFHFFQDVGRAAKRQFSRNPYRLPPWVYVCLWLSLMSAITSRLVLLMTYSEFWHEEWAKEMKDSDGERQAQMRWVSQLPDIFANTVQFSLFMFPPLLGGQPR